MNDEERGKYNYNNCIQPISPSMVVCQLVGENQTQKSIDLHIRVPRRNPAMEQIIDVYVKDLKLTYVTALCDKVVARGCFEVKVLYTACKPKKPVHAVEVRNIRFTADVDIWGASSGMDAEADVVVEFVDYDCDECTRPHWYKRNPDWSYGKGDCDWEDDCDCEEDCDWEDDCDCEDDYDGCECDQCKTHKHHHGCECDHCKSHKHHHGCECDHCKPHHKKKKVCCDCGHDYDHCSCDHGHHHWKKGARHCDVTVVLRVTAKVFRNRPLLVQHGGMHHGGMHHGGMHHGSLPVKPKG